MHQSSYDKVVDFRARFLRGREAEPLRIYDLGSQDVNGSYRPIFDAPAWRYVGVDMTAGRNVDVVLAHPYRWRELATGSADVLVSGQAFEHIAQPWAAILEVARVLAPGGVCCLVAPSSGPEHRYPVDCWRIYPDGFVALAALAELEVLEVATQWEDRGYVDGSDTWHDSVLIARRPRHGPWNALKAASKRWIRHRTLTLGVR
jgi:SAM-dependent methyltransferase